jgi:hypothetical protein
MANWIVENGEVRPAIQGEVCTLVYFDEISDEPIDLGLWEDIMTRKARLLGQAVYEHKEKIITKAIECQQ